MDLDPRAGDGVDPNPTGDELGSIGFQLWEASNAWQRAIRDALEPLGLTHVQFRLLSALGAPEWDGAVVTQSMLARRTRLDEMMTSQVVRVLEAKGLIERGPHPRDSRAKTLTLTEEGRVSGSRAAVLAAETERLFLSPLGNDLEVFAATIVRLNAAR